MKSLLRAFKQPHYHNSTNQPKWIVIQVKEVEGLRDRGYGGWRSGSRDRGQPQQQKMQSQAQQQNQPTPSVTAQLTTV